MNAINHVISPITLAVVSLVEAREAVASVAGKTGEKIAIYSGALCQAFNLVNNLGVVTTPWYDLKGKLKAGINAERVAFKALFPECPKGTAITDIPAGMFAYGVGDSYWLRCKLASGYQTAGMRASGSGEITVDMKTLADLKTILNRIFKAEEGTDESGHVKASDNKHLLMDVYGFLGGDIDNLG